MIILSLTTQYENLGDELINLMLLRQLAKSHKIIALSSNAPEWYIENIKNGLQELQSNVTLIEDSKIFYITLTKKVFSNNRIWLFTSCGDVSSSRPTILKDLLLLALQYLSNLRVAQVGASISRITSSRATLLKISQNRGKNITVRDTASQELLRKQHINVRLVPDLSFLLQTTAIKPLRSRLALISIRYHTDVDVERLLRDLKSLFCTLSKHQLLPAFTWQVSRDAEFCRHLANMLNVPIRSLTTTTSNRLQAAFDLYDEADVVISNRLHVLLLAASRNTCPIAMLHTSEIKIRAVMRDMDMYDNIICDSSTIEKTVDHILHNKHATKLALEKTFRENSEIIKNYLFENITV